MAPTSYYEPTLTVTGTETSVCTYVLWHKVEPIKRETKEQQRTRIALEKNRASWFVFNERMPNVKQIIKASTNFYRNKA